MSCSQEFETITEGLSDALDFSRTIGVDGNASFERGGARSTVGEVDFYTRSDKNSLELFHLKLSWFLLVTKVSCWITSKLLLVNFPYRVLRFPIKLASTIHPLTSFGLVTVLGK